MIDFHRDPASDDVVFSHQSYYYGNHRGIAEDQEEDDPGTDTPPLWRASPPASPPPRQEVTNYRCLSPASKAQAIARGQKELMEMVSRMPESCYELSLRDLVEHPPPAAVESNQRRTDEENFRKEVKRRSDERKFRSNRSGRYENHHNGGLFLKTVIPIYVGVNRSNRKKNQLDLGKNNGSTSNSRVSPKPPPVTAAKGAEKDWWKKRSSELSGSESIGSSTRSGSTKSSGSSSRNSNSSSRHQQRGGCWSFLRGRKNKRS